MREEEERRPQLLQHTTIALTYINIYTTRNKVKLNIINQSVGVQKTTQRTKNKNTHIELKITLLKLRKSFPKRIKFLQLQFSQSCNLPKHNFHDF